MRLKKKEYYNRIQENSKNNTQRTWKVISYVLRNRGNKSDFPSYFLNSFDATVDNLESIVDDFNDYFVGAGPTWASKIVVTDDKKDLFNTLINGNTNSMFLCGVNETDIIEIVRKIQNKRSTHINSGIY